MRWRAAVALGEVASTVSHMTTQPSVQVLSLTELVARVEAAPNGLDKLGAIRELRVRVAEVERVTCIAAQAAGSTLKEIGQQLGISKQAVGKRLNIAPPAVVEAKPAAPRPVRTVEKVYAVRLPGGRTLLEIARQAEAPRRSSKRRPRQLTNEEA